MDSQTTKPVANVDRAGWTIERYAEATATSRSAIYALPAALQPEHVKIGRRRIITEPPAAWLARLRERQSAGSAA